MRSSEPVSGSFGRSHGWKKSRIFFSDVSRLFRRTFFLWVRPRITLAKASPPEYLCRPPANPPAEMSPACWPDRMRETGPKPGLPLPMVGHHPLDSPRVKNMTRLHRSGNLWIKFLDQNMTFPVRTIGLFPLQRKFLHAGRQEPPLHKPFT